MIGEIDLDNCAWVAGKTDEEIDFVADMISQVITIQSTLFFGALPTHDE